MSCGICGDVIGSTSYYNIMGVCCPKCNGKIRDNMQSVPSHIPNEQHKRYVTTILGRKLGIEKHNR